MKKFNILVIDDNIGDKGFLQEMLVANEFAVTAVASGKEGLQLLKETSFDLIFIEIELINKDAYKTCQIIKSNKNVPATPVIFIIGNQESVFVKEIYDSGGDDYVIRPFVWNELMMKVRTHLELKYSREMAKNMNQILEAKVAQRTIELEDSLKKLEQAKKELELLSIAKSEFLNLISHEIRTPLNGILGSLALIGRYHYTEEVDRYFSLLDTSVKRLERFSNIILEASTLRLKGEKALVMVEFDIVKVIKRSIEQCAARYSEKKIEVVLHNDTTNSSLKGDHKFLLKCFNAVLDNSFKFSPENSEVEVNISNDSEGFLKITIADKGKGFSKAAMKNIYMPLGNHEAHFDQNTGMGLHLAKVIVVAHSGSITVGNQEPSGAVVEIKIPKRH
jgi:two-component system sensor histidine kinase/response regulator